MGLFRLIVEKRPRRECTFSSACYLIAQVFTNITIDQLDKFGGAKPNLDVIRRYELIAAFTVSVSQVSLAYDNNDSYEEFDVEFAYQYHVTKDIGSNQVKVTSGG